MSEETTGEPGAADTAPGTEPVAPATEGADSTTSPPAKRSTVEVPKWAALALAALVLVGVGFAIGWVAAPGGGHGDRFEARVGIQGPVGPNGRLPRPQVPGPGAASGVFLGVATQDATGASGAQIQNVVTGSPADQAGLKAGDDITAVDGTPVTSAAQLATRVRAHQPGDQIQVTYTRGGASAQATVNLGTRSPAGTPSA